MRILGIDPGLQVCGYACLEVGQDKEKLIEAGIIRTDGGSALQEKLNRIAEDIDCLLYTSPSPRDRTRSRMPSSA